MFNTVSPSDSYLFVRQAGDDTLSSHQLASNIKHLQNMKGIISCSTARSMRKRWESQLIRIGDGDLYDTIFEAGSSTYVLARVNKRSWCVQFYIVDEPVSSYTPIRHLNDDIVIFHITDMTTPGVENSIPLMSGNRAISIVDRWIALIEGRLPIQDGRIPPVLLDVAKGFIGSVALECQKQAIPDYTLPNYDEEDGCHVHRVVAHLPTAHRLPQISYNVIREDDWDSDYNYLTLAGSAIYACALPSVIQIEKCWLAMGGSNKPLGPYGLSLGDWNSPKMIFEPNHLLESVMNRLPSLPKGSIISPRKE